MFVTEYPPCDCNEEHTAVIHCPACEENFCSECDVMIHARKKNKDHTREPIELQAEQEPEPEPEVEQEPVPCDSDPSHVAVMYCEDCEENFCGDCDYAFHSRKKTANHSRFEGARRPEDIEALKREAELEAQAAAAAGGAAPAPQNATSAPAGSAATSYAAVAAAGGASAAAAPTAAASAASPSSAASSPASATDPAAGGKKPKKTKETSAQRVAEHKAAWDERRKALCKSKYNVGHWLGLTTEDRKELAQSLCAELLFNPQPSKAKGLLVTVEWAATTYWTTYEVDVTCTKTTVEKRKKAGTNESRIATSVTVYSVHVDDMGRLASFDITVDGEAQGGCSIM